MTFLKSHDKSGYVGLTEWGQYGTKGPCSAGGPCSVGRLGAVRSMGGGSMGDGFMSGCVTVGVGHKITKRDHKIGEG